MSLRPSPKQTEMVIRELLSIRAKLESGKLTPAEEARVDLLREEPATAELWLAIEQLAEALEEAERQVDRCSKDLLRHRSKALRRYYQNRKKETPAAPAAPEAPLAPVAQLSLVPAEVQP